MKKKKTMKEKWTQADEVMETLQIYGDTTSLDMRCIGIKRPSSVIAKLRARGVYIQSKIVNTKNGREMAIYTLGRRKPPYIRIWPWWDISKFWKHKRR